MGSTSSSLGGWVGRVRRLAWGLANSPGGSPGGVVWLVGRLGPQGIVLWLIPTG
jgi:hypothetical protein